MAMRGKCTGTAANCHVAAGEQSNVIFTLQPEEDFAILHTSGSGDDSWLAVRNQAGQTGYLRASTPMTTTGSLDPRPKSLGPEEFAPDGVRDMMIGAAFAALGVFMMFFFTGIGLDPGFGKHWLVFGYGIYRFGKGMYSYVDR